MAVLYISMRSVRRDSTLVSRLGAEWDETLTWFPEGEIIVGVGAGAELSSSISNTSFSSACVKQKTCIFTVYIKAFSKSKIKYFEDGIQVKFIEPTKHI